MSDDRHLAALRTYWKQNSSFPSMSRLCDVVGLSSPSSVFALVGRLSEGGYLERVDGRVAPTKKFFARPLLGSVRAGLPQPADQSPPEVLTLDDYLIDEPNRTSLHRVRGDSMRDVGILDGDLVALEHNAPAGPGDIVVAVCDGDSYWPCTRVSQARRNRSLPTHGRTQVTSPSRAEPFCTSKTTR